MYSVSVKRSFTAEHFLIGGDWGAENQPHSHDYQVEVQLEGATLDRHGYLVDIVEIKAQLESWLDYFGKRSLNELPEFQGLNPSLEHFARIFCQSLAKQIQSPNLSAITVKLWEDESAWATYRQEQ
jgi:6-pyruvoyltetrahydropterin/6-carboxytetrahydropterin synthase